MDKKKTVNLIRYAILSILMLFAYLAQTTVTAGLQIGAFKAYLLIPVVVCAGMFEKEIAGAVFGLAAGLMWDGVSQNLWGFNALFLVIIGFLSAIIIRYLLRNSFLTGMLLCFAASLLYGVVYWVCFTVIPGYDDALYALVYRILPSCLYTAAFMPVFYLIIRILKKRLRPPAE